MNQQPPTMLIAGGAHSDVPMIRAARSLGYHVVTSGNRPEDPGHQFAHQVELCDYSDTAAMLKMARRIQPSAVCPGCNDFAAISAAEIAFELGLPGHDHPETVATLHHKDRWREFALKHGIASPRAIGCRTPAEAAAACQSLTWPLLIKPVDLTGGRGINRVDRPEQATDCIREAFNVTRAGRVVVEEFIEGSRHGFTCILRERRPVFWFADNEHYHLSQWLVSGASAPSALPDNAIRRLRQLTCQVAEELHLVAGIFHVQLILTPNGDPVIIEICRRPPGDLYVDLVRHAAGVPYAEWIVRAFAGLDLTCVAPANHVHPVTRHCLMTDAAGVLQKFEFDSVAASKIIDQMLWGAPGDIVSAPERHKFGIVFLKYADAAEMERLTPHLQQLLKCQTSAN
ncbi:MAG: hypothetical protein RLZZ436_935 [Planctomycetota bacterium]|jgi:biotin carboxylase